MIACLSVGNICLCPAVLSVGRPHHGLRVVGDDVFALADAVGVPPRGGAAERGLTATYRSCNFGDSATIFSNSGSFHAPQNIIENYYSVYSGAGMTWYKMDIWYQYHGRLVDVLPRAGI